MLIFSLDELFRVCLSTSTIQLLYGFRVWMAWSKHARKLRELFYKITTARSSTYKFNLKLQCEILSSSQGSEQINFLVNNRANQPWNITKLIYNEVFVFKSFKYYEYWFYSQFMISVFGWPDPNTGFNQSEHALYTCYFIITLTKHLRFIQP